MSAKAKAARRAPREIGLRELKATLSKQVQRVKQGETLVITDRGRPVAHLIPAAKTDRDIFLALARAGVVAWNGEDPPTDVRMVKTLDGGSVSELLLDNRE